MFERLGQALTVGTVIGFIAQIFGASTRNTAIAATVGLLVSMGISYLLQRNPNIGGTLRTSRVGAAFLIPVILIAILIGALIRQHWMNNEVTDLQELNDSFQWRLRLCFGRENCHLNVLTELPGELTAKSEDAPEELFADQALGKVVRSSPAAMETLRHAYGVYKTQFLGTGQSITSDSKDFTTQRIPEYLVPNYPDDHTGVLAWQIPQENLSLLNSSLQVLLDSKTIHNNPSDAQVRDAIRKNLGNAATPSLVRFAMVPDLMRGHERQKYSGCFGLPERKRVFFSDLDYMIKNTNTVQGAAQLSGYQFSTGAEKQDLYVFMFVPFDSSEHLSPTWRNLLTHLKDPSACPQ
jgi:hypothetical protein